ncbi:hypothetical protein ACMHYB_24030 [Sorangium sp. So ce1128]
MPAKSGSRLSVAEIGERFRELTLLMYTTSVPLDELREQVYPYLAPDVEFIDPWIRARGAGKFRIGLLGFHCAFLFDFDIFQINVSMNERGDGGRVLVDGVMNLRQLRVYTYPLRTLLVYDFVMTKGGEGFEITRQEEMWSFGDMIQNAPLIGTCYEGFRFVSGYFFAGFFWLSCVVATRIPWSKQFQRS